MHANEESLKKFNTKEEKGVTANVPDEQGRAAYPSSSVLRATRGGKAVLRSKMPKGHEAKKEDGRKGERKINR